MSRNRIIGGVEAPRYSENPFLRHTAEISKARTKPIFMTQNGEGFIVNALTGELEGTAGLVKREVIESNKFVKLYVEGVAALFSLKEQGKKVFLLIYKQIVDAPQKTEIVLNYSIYAALCPDTLKELKISRTTFNRGINQCLEQKIIAQSLTQHVYYVNPAFVFNGNRLSIIREYIRKGSPEAETIYPTLESAAPAEEAQDIPLVDDDEPPEE